MVDTCRVSDVSCWRTYVEFTWEDGSCIYPFASISFLRSQTVMNADGTKAVIVTVNGESYQTSVTGYEDLYRNYVSFMERARL